MSNIKKVLVGASIAMFALLVTVSTVSAQGYSWTRSLSQGSKGADVTNLQKFLNMCADTQVSTFGAGSPGMETSTFGPATRSAVAKFQMKWGITPAAGYFGPVSQAKATQLQASGNICGPGVVTPGLPAGCTSTAGYSPISGQSCAGTPSTPSNPSNPTTPSGLKGTVGSLDYTLVSSLLSEETSV